MAERFVGYLLRGDNRSDAYNWNTVMAQVPISRLEAAIAELRERPIAGIEKGFGIHQAWRGQSWQPDPLILDDQALIAHVAGRGLVVLTGCGHAGVINICRYAQRLTGVEKLHAVIGGFHLAGPLFEPVITDTVSALEQLAPEVIVPAHCTGWKATHAIARRLPGAFIQNSVGTTFHLTAA